MRILYLCQRVPYPPNRGDKIATYHHIRHLARNHDVSVACLADGVDDLANTQPLAPLVSSIDAVPVSRQRGRLRMLAALATGKPLTLAYFGEPELHERVGKLVRNRDFDVIVVYSSGMAQFVEEVTGIPRIMFFSDLDSLKWQQYAENVSRPMSWVYALEARRLLNYERQVAATFHQSIVCSERELHDCRRLMPDARVSCISNGVDLEYFRPLEGPKEKDSLVFTGVMDYLPNVDGASWFCAEVLPLIRAEIPGVTFTICGSRPCRSVRALARIRGVRVTGQVPDVRHYLARASVGVVPLRIARGIQNKLLEAMAMGLPTVTTTAAFAGMDSTYASDVLVADTAARFAACVVRLLKDADLRESTGRSARVTVQNNYSWDVRLNDLETAIDQLVVGSRRAAFDTAFAG